MLDARSWVLAKKGVIPYRYPVSRNQYPVSRPNEAQISLYGDETVNHKNIILRAIYVPLCLRINPKIKNPSPEDVDFCFEIKRAHSLKVRPCLEYYSLA
jgi:hypothetical protein